MKKTNYKLETITKKEHDKIYGALAKKDGHSYKYKDGKIAIYLYNTSPHNGDYCDEEEFVIEMPYWFTMFMTDLSSKTNNYWTIKEIREKADDLLGAVDKLNKIKQND